MNNSNANKWLKNERLPMLLRYGLISEEDYMEFDEKMGQLDLELEYSILKGKGANGGKRADALCTGIVQAVIDGQQSKEYIDAYGEIIIMRKPYTDDWSAEGYLRWAVSCGFLEYNRENDCCRITPFGVKFSQSVDGSQEEKELLEKALLSYPPVIRILSLLEKSDNQTKFDLGSKLGFKGELGFTSIPQGMYLCDYCEAANVVERNKVRSNDEGDSDKYARGIASWCMQMGWIEKSKKKIIDFYRGHKYEAILQTYSITRSGEKALIKARGNSSHPRLPKIVMFEMLASNKAHGADYLRYQRAAIIKILSKADKTLEQLKRALKGYDLEIDDVAIKDHIVGLISIGIDISFCENKYHLLDKISGLQLPERSACIKDNINDIVERVRSNLSYLNHEYLILVELAYSDAATKSMKNLDAREFEIQTANLFTKELNFDGMRLGDSNKPDVIISYGDIGTIIDNKSYKEGFNINATSRDEMSRYINENTLRSNKLNPNEWWLNFGNRVSKYTFLFITSYLKGEFQKQLEYISKANGNIKGAAIGIESLLYLADGIKGGKYTYKDFYDRFDNSEMKF